MLKLNIGSGPNRIEGYVHLDNEESCNPDVLHDIMESPLPYEEESVDEILFFHCIEHIPKKYHDGLFKDFHRVLKVGGKLYISYPNFEECAKRWLMNFKAARQFWEATIFGRQLHGSDYHVCAVTPDYIADLLLHCGFDGIVSTPEENEGENSITYAHKSNHAPIAYEKLVSDATKEVVVEIH